MKPNEIWDLELWEYNIYVQAFGEQQKYQTAQAIMTGYYAAYYTNGGKKAKKPDELIKKLFIKKQNLDEGLKAIERLKEMEKSRG